MLHETDAVAFLPSGDLHRSEGFFHGVLGLPVLSRSPYATVFAVGGATLRVTRVDDLQPQPFTVFGWQAGDLRSTVRALTERGVVLLRFDGMGQDADGVWTTPTGDLVVWFHDPDSNVLSITQLVS